MHNEVPGATVPSETMDRMKKAQEISSEKARQEGVAIAQEVLFELKEMVEGVQISAPLGKYELALEVLKSLKIS